MTSHEPPAGIDPPVRVNIEMPVIEVLAVAVPPQVFPGLPETTRPIGNLSMSGEVMVAAVLLELVRVIVRVETPRAPIVAGLKALPSVGRIVGALTVKVAMAGAALLPLLLVKAPTPSELM